MRRILIVGDAVANTGFSSVVHNIADNIKGWDVHILGVNYRGDPHNSKHKIYPALAGGDVYGYGRIRKLAIELQPEVIFIINDPWVIGPYLQELKDYRGKLVLYTPIDALNLKEEYVYPLNKFDTVVAYTEFGKQELKRAGLKTNCVVIPHGVDTKSFYPIDRNEARADLGIPKEWFIILNIGRNSPRKRIDLAMNYFTEWAENKPEARFHYHGVYNDAAGFDIKQYAKFLGIGQKLMLTSEEMTPDKGVSTELLNKVYNACDLFFSTTGAEGFYLPLAEAMACRKPCLVPYWSALADWPCGGVSYINCTGTYTAPGISTVHGVADREHSIQMLNLLYKDQTYRDEVAQCGYELISQDKFRWAEIGKQFNAIFKENRTKWIG